MSTGQSQSLSVETNTLTELSSITIDCLESVRLSKCQRALSLTEELQRQAAEYGNYSCQSLLLGLGAELIMASLNEPRTDSALAIFRDLEVICRQ